MATKQGGQSVISALNNPFGQVLGYYDHFGGKNRLTIFSVGGGLDIDTDYEYTIPGSTGIDPDVYKYITPTCDGSGMKMQNTYTRRFHTSKIRITEPQSSSVKVLQGCNEWDIMPTVTSPVSVAGKTTSDVDMVMVNSTTGETGKSATMTPGTPYNTFSRDFYFKQPGKKEVRVTGYKQYTESGSGARFFLPHGGEDYIKLNVQSPPPQNWLGLEYNEDLIESDMALPVGYPGGLSGPGFTVPYGCYDERKQFYDVYNYHLYVKKSVFQFISIYDIGKDYRENFDVFLLDDPPHSGYFYAVPGGDVAVDISSIPVEINTTYTNIAPVIKPEPPPIPDYCLTQEYVWSCNEECIICPEPPDPEFKSAPALALYKGIGKRLHVKLKTKQINFYCGYATAASLGIITCHQDLLNYGARVEDFTVEYDLIPALLITIESQTNPPEKIPSPPYRPFFLVRNFHIPDIGGVVMPCIPNWIVEEFALEKLSQSSFENPYQIDLQSRPEWGTYYFTGGIQVEEQFNPHTIKVFFEYLPGLRDN